MTTIIGIDGSLSATGLAIWRDGLIAVSTVHTEPGPPEPRWRVINQRIWAARGGTSPDLHTLAVVEGVFAHGKMLGTTLDLAMLHGTIRLALHYAEVPFAIVDTQAIKQYATGNGRPSKREMVAACSRLRLKFNVGDDNQADALWLLAMALHHYGRPMCDTGPAGLKALARPVWPTWSVGVEEGWR